VSVYQLLAAKQGEIDARRGYLESLRDYWSARAELARAIGGSPPEKPNGAIGKVGQTGNESKSENERGGDRHEP